MGTIETPWVRVAQAQAQRLSYWQTSEHGERVTRSVPPCLFLLRLPGRLRRQDSEG
jgi:hypothetical protein